MRKRIAQRWLPLIALLAVTQGQAESLVDGSADAGKSKSLTCTACHGVEGISVMGTWPNIAGQGAPYIVDQLTAFKNGAMDPGNRKRYEATMSPMTITLSEQDMRDLAVYYESLPAPAQAVADPALIAKGEALYRGGDLADATSACLACHGPTGRGNPAAKYPALRGQHAVYTAKQLRDYKSGARTTDGTTRIMRDIAASLSEEDIVALAAYIQGLK